MNVGIGTVAAQFLSREYMFRIFGIVLLMCDTNFFFDFAEGVKGRAWTGVEALILEPEFWKECILFCNPQVPYFFNIYRLGSFILNTVKEMAAVDNKLLGGTNNLTFNISLKGQLHEKVFFLIQSYLGW
jgi:hypothetical protein